MAANWLAPKSPWPKTPVLGLNDHRLTRMDLARRVRRIVHGILPLRHSTCLHPLSDNPFQLRDRSN
jgi:hypothetical protein